MLREQVAKCYRREGINHFELCKQEVANYVTALRQVQAGKPIDITNATLATAAAGVPQ